MQTGLERILSIKEDLLDKGVRELEAIRAEIRATREAMEQARTELQGLSAGNGEISSADLMVIHGAREALRKRIEELTGILARLETLENQHKDRVKKLYEDKEKVRRLHERKLKELERELQRKETRMLDEFALRSGPKRD